MPRISVLTPTYNRAEYLPRLYESLKKSTCKDFEWIIVNDGSTDDTASLCQKYIEDENEFVVRYFFQENQGKHIALNKLIDEANGEYILPIDDDDELLPYAIENGLKAWDFLQDKEQRYWCVCSPNIDGDSRESGGVFPHDINSLSKKKQKKYVDSMRYETCEIRKTKLQKKTPYPVIEGVKFVPETTTMEQIDKNYERYYINDSFIAYHQHGGFRLTNMGTSNERYLSDVKLYSYLLSNQYVKYRSFSRLRIRSEYALYKAMRGLRNNGYYTQPTVKLVCGGGVPGISLLDKLIIMLCWKSKFVRKKLSKIW